MQIIECYETTPAELPAFVLLTAAAVQELRQFWACAIVPVGGERIPLYVNYHKDRREAEAALNSRLFSQDYDESYTFVWMNQGDHQHERKPN